MAAYTLDTPAATYNIIYLTIYIVLYNSDNKFGSSLVQFRNCSDTTRDPVARNPQHVDLGST